MLGLLVEPSWAGLVLGLVALLAFVARAPLKLALVDRLRGRDLARTRLARRVAAVEIALLLGLIILALLLAEASFLWPLAWRHRWSSSSCGTTSAAGAAAWFPNSPA